MNALMPQVYLPQGYAGNTAGGVISGNDVKLTFADTTALMLTTPVTWNDAFFETNSPTRP